MMMFGILFIFILLIILPPSAWARPAFVGRIDTDDADVPPVEKCGPQSDDQNRHTYFWTVVHSDHPDVTHHLFGYLPFNDALPWDSLAPEVRAHFDAASVAVFESSSAGMAQLQACVRDRAENGGAQLPAALAERLDAYLFRHPRVTLLPHLDREWRALPADWLLAALMRVHIDQTEAVLQRNSSAESAADNERRSILQRMKNRAWHAGKRAEYVERAQDLCRILPSLDEREENREMLPLGVTHLLDELEETERAAPARVRAGPIGRAPALYRCGRFEARDDMLGEAEHWLSGSGDPERRAQLEKLNHLLLRDLIARRNTRFVERIVPMLLRNGTQAHFIALVATHFLQLPGDAGASIVDALRRHGFRVDEVQAAHALPTDADAADVQNYTAVVVQDNGNGTTVLAVPIHDGEKTAETSWLPVLYVLVPVLLILACIVGCITMRKCRRAPDAHLQKPAALAPDAPKKGGAICITVKTFDQIGLTTPTRACDSGDCSNSAETEFCGGSANAGAANADKGGAPNPAHHVQQVTIVTPKREAATDGAADDDKAAKITRQNMQQNQHAPVTEAKNAQCAAKMPEVVAENAARETGQKAMHAADPKSVAVVVQRTETTQDGTAPDAETGVHVAASDEGATAKTGADTSCETQQKPQKQQPGCIARADGPATALPDDEDKLVQEAIAHVLTGQAESKSSVHAADAGPEPMQDMTDANTKTPVREQSTGNGTRESRLPVLTPNKKQVAAPQPPATPETVDEVANSRAETQMPPLTLSDPPARTESVDSARLVQAALQQDWRRQEMADLQQLNGKHKCSMVPEETENVPEEDEAGQKKWREKSAAQSAADGSGVKSEAHLDQAAEAKVAEPRMQENGTNMQHAEDEDW